MTSQLNRLTIVFAAGFLAVALATGYWQIVQSDSLLGRVDNPRRLLTERRNPRGDIYDRNGQVLADATGTPGAWSRHYPYPALAPVLGYVSPFLGSAGIEAAFDPVLHGDGGLDPLTIDWRTQVLGAPPPGRAVRLTIDLNLQRAADTALGAQAGAAVLLQAQTGEILALASHPTFDANDIDTHWTDIVNNPGSPLVNRATQSLYQPGGVLAPVVIAGALHAGLVQPDQSLPDAVLPVTVGSERIVCRQTPPSVELTLTDTLAYGCPWPVAQLAGQLGNDGLSQIFAQFHFYNAPELDIPTTAPAFTPGSQLTDTAAAGVGQGLLTVTPLRMALVAAALARGGQMPTPMLVLQTQNPDLGWQSARPAAPTPPVIDPAVAAEVKGMLRDGLQATAVTSSGGKTLAWYLGFAPFNDPQYVVVVLLEAGTPRSAKDIGDLLLGAAQ